MGGKSKQTTNQQTETKSDSTSSQTTTLNPTYNAYTDDIINRVKATGLANQGFNDTAQATNQRYLNQIDDTVAGKYLNPDSNPTISAYADALRAQSAYDLQKKAVQIGDVAQAQGAYGGTRQGVVQGVATAENQMNLDQLIAGMYAQNYQAERERQVGAGQQIAGAVQNNQTLNYADLEELAKVVSAFSGFNSTTTGTNTGTSTGTSSGTTVQTANPIQQAIQLAAIFAPK